MNPGSNSGKIAPAIPRLFIPSSLRKWVPSIVRIALVGTRGVPARYGGFETCVEEVGSRLAERGHDVVVYCRTTHDGTRAYEDRRLARYRGMRLVHLPAVRSRTMETLSHTGLCVTHLLAHPADAVVMFNAANSTLLPALRARRLPVVTHVDGLEWQRAKWGGAGRRYYRIAEALAVRWSDALIADATGIADYYRHEFDADTELIAYGAPILADAAPERLAALELTAHGYHLVVARFEPENNIEAIVRGYTASSAKAPLIVVGSAPYADEHTRAIHAAADDRVRFVGGVWDQPLLDSLYANAITYVHGHSVGGTNPSLLRAIGAGAPVIAYDVGFNREVLEGAGRFFADAAELTTQIEAAEAEPDATRDRGLLSVQRAHRYDWDEVADRYEQLCEQLGSRRDRPRPSGRRNRHTPAGRGGRPR